MSAIAISPQDAARKAYDVVIVGAGIAGAIMAKELANAGKQVLIIEAGRATSIRPEGYASYVDTFHKALAKTPNSPYPANPNAPQSSVLFQQRIRDGNPVTAGYQVYKGPLPFFSTFTKSLGGTTLHFLGTCIRMLPNDFTLKETYGVGVDWPISYEDLMPFYEQAELEIGVSADVKEQEKEGTPFAKDYQYPMRQIPPTYLDRWLKANLAGLKYPDGIRSLGADGLSEYVQVVGTPAGRNGMPNAEFTDPRTGHPYRPAGAPYDSRTGQRCEGNSACVPICPVMAKYNALRSLYTLDRDAIGNRDIVTQAVASRILFDETGKQVVGIECKLYDDEDIAGFETVTFRGRRTNGEVRTRFVIAAHAIETAKLLLASDVENRASGRDPYFSGPVGNNLMDHPYMLTWGLAPKGTHLGVYRGPQITSEIPMRDGGFREEFAGFRADIRNGGWDFATMAPYTNVSGLVGEGLWGTGLRQQLRSDVGRQISFGFQIEQLPDDSNRVEIDEQYKDQLGNYRPVIHYDIDDYSRKAMAVARKLSDSVMSRVGGKNMTGYDHPENQAGYLGKIDGNDVVIHGAGHINGTHRMGNDPSSSVVDADQRVWARDGAPKRNLFLVGCGNMPTIGSSNPTLTMAALACKAAARIKEDLDG